MCSGMALKLCQFLESIFKVGCFTVVIYMMSLWIEKYMKDEDLCLVDYRSFKNRSDMELPKLSLCLTQPFIDHNLENLGVSTKEYLDHLKGESFNQSLAQINFTNVTINLENYYISTSVVYEDGTTSTSIDAHIYSTFTGFFYGSFAKCFTVDTNKLNMDDVKFVAHLFKMDTFLYYLKDTLAIFHSPSQFL